MSKSLTHQKITEKKKWGEEIEKAWVNVWEKIQKKKKKPLSTVLAKEDIKVQYS